MLIQRPGKPPTSGPKTRLYQGDCLQQLQQLPDHSIDLVLADPPYGTTQARWDSLIPLEPLWQQLNRVIKPKHAIVLTASQPFTTTVIHSNLVQFRYCWVWNKVKPGTGLRAKIMPLKVTEDIVVFGDPGLPYFPQMTAKTPRVVKNKKDSLGAAFGGHTNTTDHDNKGLGYPKDLITLSNANQKQDRYHPTQKPVELMEYLIRTYTESGQVVLDFCMGSGTTGVAAKKVGRSFVGIELDLTYFNIARGRIRAA